MHPEAIAYHQQGVRLQQTGHLTEAANAYREALAMDEGLELTRANLAMVLHQLGESDSAIEQYRRLLEKHPRNTKARFNLGIVYASVGQLERAIAEYRQVLTTDPHHAMALGNLGWILQQQQRWGEAIAVLERLKNLTPDDVTVAHQLGLLHRRVGDIESAERCWKELLEKDPRQVPTLLALSELNRVWECHAQSLNYALDALAVEPHHPAALILAARSHMALLEYGPAADILFSLAERLPQNAEVRYHLGCLAHERNQLSTARHALAEACRLTPGWFEAHSELGAVLYRMRLFDDAIEHYRIAESLAPENPIIKANIGFCYVEVGELEAARQYFAAYEHQPSQNASIDLAVRCAQDLL